MKIGIDVGGTKIEIICLDDAHQSCYRHRINTPKDSIDTLIAAIGQLVEDAQAHVHGTVAGVVCATTVGVGIPGSVSQRTQVVKNSNLACLNGKPFVQALEQRLGRPVRVENDADCFALSEATDGIAAHKASVFGVIIGTGCGGGLVINGHIVSGLHGIGGEWGHNPLPFPQVWDPSGAVSYDVFDQHKVVPQADIYRHKASIEYFAASEEDSEYPGYLCYCGKRGCLETWISGTGFANDYHRARGDFLSAQAIVAQASQGEAMAERALDRYCERLAKGLAHVINLVDPHAIVLGGGMSNVDYLYEEVPKRWQKYIFSDRSNTPLLKAFHGDSSGVRGAAFLWDK